MKDAVPLDLVLASASPRRRELLEGLGLRPSLLPTGIPEDLLPGEAPEAHVSRLAEAKGLAAAARIPRPPAEGTVILAADTAVVIDGAVLGKPRDDEDAAGMLLSLSGRTHDVLTGCRLIHAKSGRSAAAIATTRVRFREIDREVVRWYVATGEPRDKAGAYGIQGLGALLVASIDGSFTNVVGLPLETLPPLFADLGFDLFRTLSPPRR